MKADSSLRNCCFSKRKTKGLGDCSCLCHSFWWLNVASFHISIFVVARRARKHRMRVMCPFFRFPVLSTEQSKRRFYVLPDYKKSFLERKQTSLRCKLKSRLSDCLKQLNARTLVVHLHCSIIRLQAFWLSSCVSWLLECQHSHPHPSKNKLLANFIYPAGCGLIFFCLTRMISTVAWFSLDLRHKKYGSLSLRNSICVSTKQEISLDPIWG